MKFLEECKNTCDASFLKNLLIKFFSKKRIEKDDELNYNVVIGHWFGKDYFIDYMKEKNKMNDIENIRNILNEFYDEFICDRFASIKNIDDTDFDSYSGDHSDFSDFEFLPEYQAKFDILYDFIREYDLSEMHWNDLELIYDANPNSDESTIELCFKYLNQFINKIEAEQNMIQHMSKD